MLRRMQKLGWRWFLLGLTATAWSPAIDAADRTARRSAEPSYFASESLDPEALVAVEEARLATASRTAKPVVIAKEKGVAPVEFQQASAIEPQAAPPVAPAAYRRRAASEEPVAVMCEELDSCDTPWWAHRSSVWGELLYLRPGGTDITYAIEQNDVTEDAFPTGPIGQVGIQNNVGFRVGFGVCLSECSSLVASYSYWQGERGDVITREGNNVLFSTIIHPSTVTTGSQSLQAQASYDIRFNVADIGHRSLIVGDDSFALNWTAGLRYGNLQQQFQANQTVSTATGLVTVDSQVNFDGFGLLLGLDATTFSQRTGFYSYSKANLSLLAGEWKGMFRQQNQIPGGVVGNELEDFRVSPQGELEVGLGWQNCSGCLRMSVGYLATGWFNAVSMRDYIDAVHVSSYNNLGQTITFNGLVARCEFAY